MSGNVKALVILSNHLEFLLRTMWYSKAEPGIIAGGQFALYALIENSFDATLRLKD